MQEAKKASINKYMLMAIFDDITNRELQRTVKYFQ